MNYFFELLKTYPDYFLWIFILALHGLAAGVFIHMMYFDDSVEQVTSDDKINGNDKSE